MNRRQISYSIVVCLALVLLSIFFLDQPIAAFVQKVDGRSSVILQQGTSFLEVISGFPIARFALSYALLAAGLILFAWKSTRSAAWMLLFIGCAQFVTRITAGTLKNVFNRLRPFEVIEAGNWDWNFFRRPWQLFPFRPRRAFLGPLLPARVPLPALSHPVLDHPAFHLRRPRRSERSLVLRRAWFHRDRGRHYAFFHLAFPNETGPGQ